MSFYCWLRNRTLNRGPKVRVSRRTDPRFRPRFEALDDRVVPSQVSLTVTSLADSGPGTLRAAILTADAGSHSDKFTIGFSVDGTIDLHTPLPDLNNSIAIQDPGATTLTVERAAGYSFSSAIITVDAGQTASLSGLTIANGNEGGILVRGTLGLTSCIVSGNSESLGGGGIANFGTATISGCLISGNSAFLFGGGITNGPTGTLTISNSTVSGNVAANPYPGPVFTSGGGINNFGVMTVAGCNVSGNSASIGGGIDNEIWGTLSVKGSNIAGNSATYGGGISNIAGNFYGGSMTVSASTFTGNSATYGGGILSSYAPLTVRDSVFTANSATAGGAIYNDAGSTLDIRGSAFTGNSASDSGGGIYNLGTATLQQSTLSGNTAGSEGGGIFNASSGTLTVKDSTVLNNVALLGADLFNDHGSVTVNDSLIGDWFNA